MMKIFRFLLLTKGTPAAAIGAMIILGLLHVPSWGYNHPELTWKSLESPHFIVHFYQSTEPFAVAAVAVAEEVYQPLEDLYGWHDRAKIDIVLADYDDFSNGSADWLGSAVEIWTPDMRFPFRGSPTWLRNVITHELTHIFSMRKMSGVQMLGMDASISFLRPGFECTAGKTFPMMKLYPMWFAEGLAQLGSAKCGNDCWDSRRDMILRCAVLDGKALSLGQMGVFAHDQLGNEMVYNQGFSFVSYLDGTIGSEEVHKILRRASAQSCDFFSVADPAPVSSVGTVTIGNYYTLWLDSVRNAARRALPAQPTQTTCLWQKGTQNGLPRISASGVYRGWLTSNSDDSYRTDLVIERSASAKPYRIIEHAQTSWDFAKKSDQVYFIKSYDPGEHGSFYNELFRCNLKSGRTEQLTHGGRIYALAAAPTDKEVAVIRFRDGRFSLEIFDPSALTFRVIDEGTQGDPFVAVAYNPADASQLVVEKAINGRSAIYVIDKTSNVPVRITSGEAQEESPYWAPDGRIYYSADYDGIFNIYSVKPDGSDLSRHTSVVGGAFEPTTESGGTGLVFSEYTSTGFRIAQTPRASAPYTVSSHAACSFSPLSNYQQPLPEAKPYHLRMCRASWQSGLVCNVFTEDSVSAVTAALGVSRFQADVLNRFSYILGAEAVGETAWLTSNGEVSTSARLMNSAFSTYRRTSLVASRLDSLAQGPHVRLNGWPQEASIAQLLTTTNPPSQAASTSVSPLLVNFVPECGIEVNSLPCSIQSVATANLYSGIIPLAITSQTDVGWQTGRSTSVGATVVADAIFIRYISELLGGSTSADSGGASTMAPFGATIPLWFSWQDAGYYNEDVQHNYNGVSQARLEIAPCYVPATKEHYTNAVWSIFPADPVKGISGKASLFHGFPLTKYSGIPVGISGGAFYYASPVHGTLIDSFALAGNSDLYLNAQASVGLSVPLIRKIDAGSRLFYDACYGSVGYAFSATANHSFLVRLQDEGNQWSEMLFRNLGAARPDAGIAVSHLLFVSLEANSIADFSFAGGLNFTLGFDLVRRRSGFFIAAKF